MQFNLENLEKILNYSYDAEIESLEEEIEEELPENLVDAIKYCEENGQTDHIAYNLMLLKKELENL